MAGALTTHQLKARLEAECGSADEAVAIALDAPGVGNDLYARGVRDISGFSATGSEVYVPPQHERWVYRRVAEYHGCAAQDDADAGDGRAVAPSPRVAKRRVREPGKLEAEIVEECETKLRQRAAVKGAGERVSHELTLEGIGDAVGFNRERVRHIEQLLKLGWPLQKRLPDVSAEAGYVRLPSVDKAASVLGLSDAEKAARLTETSLPLT
jgi:hypothetical protein